MAEYPLPPACQAGAPRAPPHPTEPGSGCWRTAGIVSLRLCCQQGWPSTLSCSPGSTQQCQLGALRHPPAGGTDGAGGALSQAAETALPKGCTGPGQLQARLMPGGCSPAASSIWQCRSSWRHQSPLQGKRLLSPPHLTDCCCGLSTYSSHSQFFPISPSCSCSPEKSSSLHNNPKRNDNIPCTHLWSTT